MNMYLRGSLICYYILSYINYPSFRMFIIKIYGKTTEL